LAKRARHSRSQSRQSAAPGESTAPAAKRNQVSLAERPNEEDAVSASRIYKVTDAEGKEAPRLIEAVSQAAAIKVAAARYTAEAASAKEVAELMADGTKVEIA
jgi:hypothetical protein